MHFNREFHSRILCLILLILFASPIGYGGVSRTIQEQYKREYEKQKQCF